MDRSKKVKKEQKAITKAIKSELSNIRAAAKANKGNKPISGFAPMAISKMFKPHFASKPMGNKGEVRVSGGDLLRPVSTGSANNFGGTVMFSVPISPLSNYFQNTKLYYEALRYEKYRFRRLVFHWCPDAPTTTPGSIVLAYDPDAADTNISLTPFTSANQLDTGFAQVQVLMGYEDSIKGNVWENFSLNCKTVKSDPQEFYYTNYSGSDIRLAAQGQAYVALGGQTSSNQLLGSFAIEYEVDFFDPSVDQINYQTLIAGKAYTLQPSNNVSSGFNMVKSLADTNVNTNVGANNYPLLQDNNGNYYISVPPGVHYVNDQFYQATSTNPDTSYYLVANVASQVGHALATVLDGFMVGSQMYSKRYKITSPPGGGKLYSSMIGTTATSNAQRIISLLASAIPYVL